MSETKFVKTKKERNYTVLDNTFIQDASLSWKAKGLMTYLLSLPDDWEIHLSEIEKHSTDGKAALRSAINELKEHGYLMAEQKRKDNRFAEMIYVIIENPAENEKSLFTDFQKTGKQKTEKLNSENQTLQNTNNNKILNVQNTDDIYSAKPKPKKAKSEKIPLINREPKNDIEQVEKAYLINYDSLYKSGIIKTPIPVNSWDKSRKLTRGVIDSYGLETVLKAIKLSRNNDFCLKTGYNLSVILSAGVLSQLINGREEKKVSMKNPLAEFDHPKDLANNILF